MRYQILKKKRLGGRKSNLNTKGYLEINLCSNSIKLHLIGNPNNHKISKKIFNRIAKIIEKNFYLEQTSPVHIHTNMKEEQYAKRNDTD